MPRSPDLTSSSTDLFTATPSALADPPRQDLGQATTEYALVLLGAAVVALLVVTWATAGGGAGRIGQLFDRVIDAVSSKI
jgi:hypothetical protein